MGWAEVILTTIPLEAAISATATNLKLGRLSPRTVSLPANNAAKGGVQYTKSSLKQGQEMHKAYHAGEVGKEFRLPSGKRIDFLDVNNRAIHELKPFNPRAMRQGYKQLDTYLEEIQSIPRYQGDWKLILDTY
jgi:hypothetical protein